VINFGDPFWGSGATLGLTSPPDDMFSFFGDVYLYYWNWLVDPADTLY